MQLILAIEPDRRQSAKISMLARNQLQAELLVVDGVREALTTLDEQVPDLILISPMILPKDEAALVERLRELDADGLKVETLTIPPLEVPSKRARQQQKGAPNRARVTRGLRGVQECDPTVFGMHVATYLERAATMERPPALRASLRHLPTIVEIVGEDTDELAETQVTESADEATIDREVPQPEWRDVLSALRRDCEPMKTEYSERVMPTSPAAPPIAAEARSIATETRPIAPKTPVIAPAPAAVAPTPAAASAQTLEPSLKKRRLKRPPPPQDEWGFFDPQQCGLAALRVKLNEITEGHEEAKKPA